MFVLIFLFAVKGALIGGHIAKSEISHSTQSGGQVIVESIFTTTEDATSELHRSLAFYPESIDFGAWAIGTAKSHIVTLINKNTNRSVYLSSISGKTPMFYSSFFEDKIVPPQGNTTFNVVFLPRRYGKVETNLFIHTSFGQAKLPVKGEGRECPYRLRSLVDIKAPLNSTIRPDIFMYNPHAKPIQILEVYSSGGQFQLELPSGGQEGPQTLWEIPPYTSKSIIRIRFHGIQPGNHSAYIRIKIAGGTNYSNSDESNGIREKEDVLVIPVEVEILTSHGIYSPNPIIDFGKITSNENTKTVKIDLINSGNDQISVTAYELRNVNNLIKFKEADLTLILNPKNAEKNIFINGELIIKSQNNQTPNQCMELSIDIRAEIYKGSLEFQKNLTVFITGAKNYTKNEREFFIKNLYSVPVAITNITVNDNNTNVFKLRNFKPQVLLPGKKILLFKISALNETANFISPLRIETNLTSYEFPLVVCTGLLKRHTSIDPYNLTKLPDESILDFGIVPFGDFSNFGFILMTNPNPIPIQLIKWNFTNPRGVYYQSMFMGCAKKTDFISQSQLPITSSSSLLSSSSSSSLSDNKRQNLQQSLPEKFNLCLNLSSSDIAAFELAVQSFSVKSFTGVFKVWTEIEEVVTTVKFVTVMGRLEIDQSRLHFSDCFPGKRCSADISIQSTFLKTMKVASITVSVPELVFEYHTQNGLPEIKANSITDIGRIHFDPKSVCGTKCYIPQEDDTEILPSQKRTTEKSDSNNFLDFDETELRRRTELYRHFKWSLQKITFTLNTSEIRLFEFNSTIDIIWPKLVKGIQVLPPIEIGQIYDSVIVINNPSSKPLSIHLSLSDPKKAKSTSLSLPLEVVEICIYCYLTDENVFQLNDKSEHIIKPNSFIAVKIRFIGKEAGVYSTLLHIKNNLTLYEAVWITGKSVQPQFRFGNRKPGSQTPLLFEIHEKQLNICENNVKLDDGATISTKRTFTARNTGEVPILIETFFIGDRMCEGYGFKISDCSSFELKSNTSKKIDIVFTPDFTMTRISRPLVLKTNLSYIVNYTLLATIPHSYLEQCSFAMQRPLWEMYIKRMSVGMLSIAFVIVLIAAFSDSVKVLKDHVHNMSREKGPLQPPLDLRNINAKSGTTLSSSSSSSSSSTTTTTTSSTLLNDDVNNYNNGIINSDKQIKNNSILNSSTTGNTVKKRNSKRNCLQTISTQILSNRDKSWAEELAKKLNSNIKVSEAQLNSNNMHTNQQITSSANSSNLGYATSYNKSNGNQNILTTQSNKPIKDEKQIILSLKKTTRENTDSEKNVETDRKNEMKIEIIQNVEMKKPKLSFKKTKSITTATPQNAVQSNQHNKDQVSSENNNTNGSIEQKQERILIKPIKSQKEKTEIVTEKKNTIITATTAATSATVAAAAQITSTAISSSQQLSQQISSIQQTINSQNSSPTQNESSPSSMKSSNLNQKKYSKTPGRERKKEHNNVSKRSDRKQSNKYNKCSPFQFGSPLQQLNSSQIQSNTGGTNSNVWDQNQISFSHVVAQNLSNGCLDGKLTNVLNASNFVEQQQQQQQQQQQHQQQQFQNSSSISNIDNNEHDWNEADLKNHETFGTDIETKRNLIDLGPIGTRKSPSSTPVWEPLPPILSIPKSNPSSSSAPPPSHPPPPATNSSFFSSNFPIGNNNNFEYTTTDNQYLGGTSGIFDHLIFERQHQSRWDTNNVLLSLLQQSTTSNNGNILGQQTDWQTENRLWTPMGYQDEPNTSGSSLISDQINVWQRGSSSVRPPPGLSLPKQQQQLQPPPQQQQQQQQQPQQQDNNQINNNQQHTLLSTTIAATTLPTTTYTTESQNNNSDIRISANHQIASSIQPFDPFSLSSIWSNSNNTSQ